MTLFIIWLIGLSVSGMFDISSKSYQHTEITILESLKYMSFKLQLESNVFENNFTVKSSRCRLNVIKCYLNEAGILLFNKEK